MKKKILVVDDHKLMLKLMSDLLEKEGHEVATAEDGFSALDILTSFIPDIMFVDWIMPRIGGDKLCQIVRKMPHLNGCHLVVISSAFAEQEVDHTEMGADAFIAKGPFEKMAKHVLAVTKGFGSARGDAAPRPVIGLDGVHSRQVTKELLSLNRHLQTILGSMAEGILEVYSGRTVYANSAAVSLFGVPSEKLLGSYAPDLFEVTVGAQVAAILESGADEPSEIGQDSPVELNGRQVTIRILPVTEEQATSIIMITDETQRKRIEAQLIQSHKMETIGTLAGGIAHDFNNMLMGVQGNVSLMLMDMDSTHLHYEPLKSIERVVQSGARLTSYLLGYARKGRYDVKPINLNELVEETAKTFGRTRKHITIQQELAEDLFAIEADQNQLEQVLLNLYVNTADAMPGGGDLVLKTMNSTHENMHGKLYDPKPGRYVLLTVTDTGIGMDKETTDRIFDPFFTTKEMGRGIGLGLAAAFGIIKGHGGYIDVKSEKGKGTCFSIHLPATEKMVPKDVKTVEAIVKGEGTVLVVDDEDTVLQVARELLQAIGYQVLTAKDGREAVEVYRKNREDIDIVLLDMVMPVMGGGEAYDQMKEINPDVKVLLSSGYSIDGEATEILRRGCNGFIQKPFNMKKLSSRLSEIRHNK